MLLATEAAPLFDDPVSGDELTVRDPPAVKLPPAALARWVAPLPRPELSPLDDTDWDRPAASLWKPRGLPPPFASVRREGAMARKDAIGPLPLETLTLREEAGLSVPTALKIRPSRPRGRAICSTPPDGDPTELRCGVAATCGACPDSQISIVPLSGAGERCVKSLTVAPVPALAKAAATLVAVSLSPAWKYRTLGIAMETPAGPVSISEKPAPRSPATDAAISSASTLGGA